MMVRNVVMVMLFVTVIAPIILYTDRLGSFRASSSSSRDEFVEDVTAFAFGAHTGRLNLLPQELSTLKEPTGMVYSDNSTKSFPETRETNHSHQVDSMEHVSARVLSTTNNPIRQVTQTLEQGNQLLAESDSKTATSEQTNDNASHNTHDQQSTLTSRMVDQRKSIKTISERNNHETAIPDGRVRHLKDQLIRAKVYLSLPATRNNPHFTRELRLRIKEVQRALGDASKDSDLSRNAYDKLKVMEQTLAKGKQIQDDCAAMVKKLRAMLHSMEEQLRTNVLATAVVVNSTVTHAKDPANHVFHIVTDSLNFAAMRMWFLLNPPGKATIQVQNIEEFTWLNSSYSPVLKQLGSASMIDYYFRTHRSNSDPNLKFRNPKYLSILNHLRFYLPEIFPKLNKVLFLDDDIVVKKDLTGLWSLDLKGNVNGAVETCKEIFHRFDRYLNFSNPLISKNFDPHACGWAYGMNVFDLEEWKKQNITEVYHRWQKLNHDRQLWKLGTLPPGLITFWKRTYPLDRSWHVLGLGYNPSVSQKEIDRAAVIHYNGNMKPWLEIGIPKYRSYWAKYVDYDHMYMRECNINP
ncbi:hypothetical protein M0R45_012696 [Rubus argutus]|uniref:Hexosyltransferase n=1 Tax=Rubus argutus TaxID=59490 RepID=A0AAW1XJ50_RUBAR